MSIYTVTSLAPDATQEGTLLYAITQANKGGNAGIFIAENLSGETFDLNPLQTLGAVNIGLFGDAVAFDISESSGVIINFGNGVVISANSQEGAAYGISAADGTLVFTDCAGQLFASAKYEASALDAYLQVTGNRSVKLIILTNALAMTLYAEASDSDAFAYGLRNHMATKSKNFQVSGESLLTLGDVSGDITVKSGGEAYGIYSYAQGQLGYFEQGEQVIKTVSVITINDLNSAMSISGNTAAYGIFTNTKASREGYGNGRSEINIDSIAGYITINSESGNAFGFWSSGEFNLGGDISGDISIAAKNGAAGFANKVTTVADSELSGSVIADGKSAFGILSDGDSKLNISGILAAGDFYAKLGDDAATKILDQFRDGSPSSEILDKILASKHGIAYAEGTLEEVDGEFDVASSSTGANDDLTFKSGAVVIGDIQLGGGTNCITVEDGATLYSDISADFITLNFDVSNPSTSARIQSAEAGVLGTDRTTWIINVADDAQWGTYVLAYGKNGYDAAAMADYVVTINAMGQTYVTTFGADEEALEFFDLNVTDDGKIEFIYKDRVDPHFVVDPHHTVDGYNVTVEWEGDDNVGIVQESITFDGTEHIVTNSKYTAYDLFPGFYDYYVTLKDSAGNFVNSDIYTVEVKDITPPWFVTDPTATVNEYTINFSWTGADNVGVTTEKIKIDGQEYNATGSTYSFSGASVGTHQYAVLLKDAAGNETWSSMTSVTVLDVTAPLFTSGPSAAVDSYKVTVSWSATDNVGITYKEIRFDGQVYAVEGNQYIVNGASVGSHTYQVHLQDAAGNETWSDLTSVEVLDVTAPWFTADPSAAVDGYKVTITWTGADNIGVTTEKIMYDGQLTTAQNSKYIIDNQSVGNHTYKVLLQDAAGNQTWSDQYTVEVLDVTAPWFTVDPNATVNGYSVDVSWTGADNIGVTLQKIRFDGQLIAAPTATYHADNLSVGNHTYEVLLQDAAGNQTWSEQYTVEVLDVTAPWFSADPTATVNDYKVTLAWTGADNIGVTMEKVMFDDQLYTAQSSGNFAIDNLSVGDHTYKVLLQDAAANQTWSQVYHVEVLDVTPPEAPVITINPSSLTNQDVSLVASVASDVVKCEYSLNTTDWVTYTIPVIVSENRSVYFRAYDAAGNVSDVTTCTVTNIDKVPPTITVAVDYQGPYAVLTATFYDAAGIASKQYSIDGGTLTDYVSPVTVTESCIVTFYAKDNVGNTNSIDQEVATLTKPVNMYISSVHVSSAIVMSGKELNNSGTLLVSGGGTVIDTTLNKGADMQIYSGGEASATNLNSGGTMIVTSGAEALGVVIANGGYMNVLKEGYAKDVQMQAGDVTSRTDVAGIISGVQAEGSILMEVAGGSVYNLTLQKNAESSNGKITFTSSALGMNLNVIDGSVDVQATGIVRDVTIGSGATVTVASGAAVSGLTLLRDGLAEVNAGAALKDFNTLGGTMEVVGAPDVAGSTVNFAIYERVPFDSYIVSDVSLLSAASFAVTVSATEEFGTYQLAAGATNFDATVSVLGMDRTPLGSITVGGEELNYNGRGYSLAITNDILELTITNNALVKVFSAGTLIISSSCLTGYTLLDEVHSMFVSSGGIVTDTTALTGADITISRGGIASNTRLTEANIFNVQDGGYAKDVVVTGSDSILNVVSAGIAEDIVVQDGGAVEVSLAGIARNTTLGSAGSMVLLTGGTANTVVVNELGRLDIADISLVTDATINNGGAVRMSSGAVLRDSLINGGGRADIYSSGAVSNTTMKGVMCVSNGAKADSTTVIGGGKLYVLEGGRAIGTDVASRGVMEVVAGALASATRVDYCGNINVSSGASAIGTIENGGFVSVDDGAVVTYAQHVVSGLNMAGHSATAHSGTTITDSVIGSAAYILVYDKGLVKESTVGKDGAIYLNSGASTKEVALNSGAQVIVSEGATAFETEVNNGGLLTVLDHGTDSSTTANAGGNVIISQGGLSISGTINSGALLKVLSSGRANAATVDGGAVELYDTANAHYAKVTNNGTMKIFSRATATNATVQDGANIYTFQDGIASKTTISSGGILRGYTGALMLENQIAGGGIFVNEGALAKVTRATSGYMYVFSGGSAQDVILYTGGRMFINGGAVVDSTTIQYGGFACVSTGATANNVTVNNGGEIAVSSAGTVNNVTAISGGRVIIRDKGIVNNVVESGGYVAAPEDATVVFVPTNLSGLVVNNFSATLHQVTTADGTQVGSAGRLYVVGGKATNTEVTSRGGLTVSSGGTATGNTIKSLGSMGVFNSGYVDQTVVSSGGYADITSGGTATNTIVADQGTLHGDQATVTGVTIGSSGRISVSSGTASDITGNAGALLFFANANNASNVVIKDGARGYLLDKATNVDTITMDNVAVLTVSSGGSAKNISMDSGSVIHLVNGAFVQNVTGVNNCVVRASGGTVLTTDISSGGSLVLLASAMGSQATIGADAGLILLDGATVTNATLKDTAKMRVSSAYAKKTSTGSGTYLQIFEGGFAEDNTAGGLMFVSSGGSAYQSEILSGGYLYLKDDGIAEKVTVNTGAGAAAYDESLLSKVEIMEDAQLALLDGGKAKDAGIHGRVYVYSGSEIEKATITSGARISLNSFATATDITMTSAADAYIFNEATANGLNVGYGARANIYSGCTAAQVVENGGFVYIEDGAVVSFASNVVSGVIYDGNSGTVHSGTTMTEAEITSTGSLYVYNGGVMDRSTMDELSHVYLYKGATASNTILKDSATLRVNASATDIGTVVSKGAHVFVSAGGRNVSAVLESGGYVQLDSGAISDNPILRGGYFYAAEGSIVNNAIVGKNGILSVSSGAALNGLSFENAGDVYLKAGAIVNNVVVNNSGLVRLAEGTVLDDASVCGGSMYVNAGATINNTNITSGGVVHIFRDAAANNTVLSSGGKAFVSQGGFVDSTTIGAGGVMFLTANAQAGSVVVNKGGHLEVNNYASAAQIVENGGYVSLAPVTSVTFVPTDLTNLVLAGVSASLHSATTALDTVVSDDGYLDVFKGGRANKTVLNSRGYLRISSGGNGFETTVNEFGFLQVFSGGLAQNGVVNGGGYAYVYEGGKAENLVAGANGNVTVREGGYVNQTEIKSGGTITMVGGRADNTTLDAGAKMFIYDGAVVSGAAIGDNTTVRIYSGGELCNFTTGANANINCNEGAIIRMTIAGREPFVEPVIADLKAITGSPSYSLTVSPNQSVGNYTLAANAASFNAYLTVNLLDGTQIGKIPLNASFTYGTKRYSMSVTNSNLVLNISLVTLSSQSASAALTGDNFGGSFVDDAQVAFGGDVEEQTSFSDFDVTPADVTSYADADAFLNIGDTLAEDASFAIADSLELNTKNDDMFAISKLA